MTLSSNSTSYVLTADQCGGSWYNIKLGQNHEGSSDLPETEWLSLIVTFVDGLSIVFLSYITSVQEVTSPVQ